MVESITDNNNITYFFSEASQRVGILNPGIGLANHVFIAGPAFYDTDHGPEFFPCCNYIAANSKFCENTFTS